MPIWFLTLVIGISAAAGLAPAVLCDLVNHLPRDEQYTYVYHGNSQVLDHVFLSPAIAHADYDPVHVNAEFAHQVSDHDPQVVRVEP